MGFTANNGDVVGAGAVYVEEDIVDKEKSPWAHCDDAQQQLDRDWLVHMFPCQEERREVQRCSRSSLQCRSGAWAVASTSPLLYARKDEACPWLLRRVRVYQLKCVYSSIFNEACRGLEAVEADRLADLESRMQLGST